jgi:hypothetical protein
MAGKSRLQILTEGGDDAHFVKHFAELTCGLKLSVGDDHEIRDMKGLDNLIRHSGSLWNQTGFDTAFIICDADTDPVKRWEILQETLGEAALPHDPARNGTMVEFGEGRRLGIWMMPDNEHRGEFEDFLQEIRSRTPPQPAIWSKACDAVASLQAEERLFDPKDALKAEVRTWLAWQEAPGEPPGVAVKKHCFDLKHPLAERFATWLLQVRNPQGR